MMTLNDYQDAARKTAIEGSIEHYAFGLVEEAGEIAGTLKRLWRSDKGYAEPTSSPIPMPSPLVYENLKKELGDVLWYVAMLADIIEVRLEDVASTNLSKLKDRQSRGVLTGSGDNR